MNSKRIWWNVVFDINKSTNSRNFAIFENFNFCLSCILCDPSNYFLLWNSVEKIWLRIHARSFVNNTCTRPIFSTLVWSQKRVRHFLGYPEHHGFEMVSSSRNDLSLSSPSHANLENRSASPFSIYGRRTYLFVAPIIYQNSFGHRKTRIAIRIVAFWNLGELSVQDGNPRWSLFVWRHLIWIEAFYESMLMQRQATQDALWRNTRSRCGFWKISPIFANICIFRFESGPI